LTFWDWAILISVIVLVLVVVLYFLNRWSSKKMAQQNEMVEKHKQTATIYVIDKKKDKITNANLPKAMMSQVPRMGRIMKMPMVKAKVGKEIMTLMCDNKVFPALPLKKNVTVEIAGIYIVSMKGMKSKSEMKSQKKARKQAEIEVPAESGLQRFLSRFRR